eukprot:CAMPEP_0197822952 /NCGR_PEP_ID=MMETSP1437-20131217/273_1 /TAXON_ID=49252 ORGANISM="Eucampia antarctica, Strain CCMP1452" /NCGR_SAMPLE_ID=MMETSP1437 /ASSEMBLY_ACC=CAM_ASM_001096 /LENGTH=134 /DNA_ID=CAMNT_0043421859 /DNA_START=110 /DNA_END=517 /DNA_ORIENTATION=+
MTDESLKEHTVDEISKHNTEGDCWCIIGNASNGGPKVYDITKYLDDHPGGAEVLLDLAGQDADEFFEDIGHSSDARDELKRYLIGALKIDEAELARRAAAAEAKAKKEAEGGSNLVFILIAILAIAFGYYKTQM